jgi:ATP-dependent RNA helicase DeaD
MAPDHIESFAQLQLSSIMERALEKLGFSKPTPVQAAVIPLALQGSDVIGQARTGTGKTAAFAIPILEQLDPIRENPYPQALVLVPTRELAHQVYGEFLKLADGCPTACVELSGGKHLERQLKILKKGVQVAIGTPGRVIDHLRRGSLKLDRLWCVVLDEADRMLDIGFRPDIEKILRKCPDVRQTLLLSATLSDEVMEIAQRYLYEPQTVDCSKKDLSVDTIEQRYFLVDQYNKFDTLLKLLQREKPAQAIIFCRTKLGTAKLHRRLEKVFREDAELRKLRLDTIHGDMAQSGRDRVFQRLRAGDIEILVATDVLGRGIDVSTISHIINFDLPQDCDDYVHRVGRTGRMGREGIAFSFVTRDEGAQLTDIEWRINRELIRDSFADDQPSSNDEAEGDSNVRIDDGTTDTQSTHEKAAQQPPKRRLNPMRRKVTDRHSRPGRRRD